MSSGSKLLSALAIPVALVAAGVPFAAANAIASPFEVALPDLVVDGIFSIVNVPDGDAVARSYIYVDVLNAGAGFAGASSLEWTIKDLGAKASEAADAAGGSGDAVGKSATGLVPLPSFGYGEGDTIVIETTEYAADASVPGGFGRYFITVKVDAGNDLIESDETNNEATKDVFGGEVVASA